jgi:hypothetical protein
MLWLSRRPEWQRSREFETTTRTTTPGMSRTADNSFGDEDEEEDDDKAPGRAKTRVVFQPTFDTTHTIYFRGHWLRIRRSRKPDSGSEMLSIRSVLASPHFFKTLSFIITQRGRTEQLYSQAARPAGEEGIRGGGRASDPDLLCGFTRELALD